MMNMSGGADRQAAVLKQKILNAKDDVVIKGKKYYISNNGDDNNDGLSPENAWKTFNKFHAMGDFLKEGDGVLLERGSTWRVYKDITVKTGVTYCAYGKGDKPRLIGSDKNYANPSLWTKTDTENVWVADFPNDCISVGNIIFDVDKFTGWKCRSKTEVKKDLRFFADRENHKVYLYLSAGNPGEIYSDIEFCLRFDFFSCWDDTTHNVTIDNICMKYCSGGGIAFCAGGNSNITVTNCEIGFIGGDFLGDDNAVRGGNGIGFWADQKNILVKNNWVYHDYDAGISPQGSPYMIAEDIRIIENLIEYCTWSYEAWVSGSYGKFIRHIFKDNIMRFAGYSWACEQRPDPQYSSHFNGFPNHMAGCFVDSVYENNILDISSWNLVAWNWFDGPKEHTGFKVRNNTFYQSENERHMALMYGFHEIYGGTIKPPTVRRILKKQ